MPVALELDVETRLAETGVTAYELLELGGNTGRIRPDRLETWLVDCGFASHRGWHRLVPTPLGLELGGALDGEAWFPA